MRSRNRLGLCFAQIEKSSREGPATTSELSTATAPSALKLIARLVLLGMNRHSVFLLDQLELSLVAALLTRAPFWEAASSPVTSVRLVKSGPPLLVPLLVSWKKLSLPRQTDRWY